MAVPLTDPQSGIYTLGGGQTMSSSVPADTNATIVATKHPKVATVERKVKLRPRGTVYVDYLQNILGKTLATAYSARASE